LSTSSTSGLSGTLGTSGGAISFPGVVSGIDYNSIIQQLTKLTLEPTVSLNAAVATLNNANVELVNINNLLQCVQNSLENLSNPDLFDAYSGTSSNPTAATATGVTGESAVPGAYVIESDTTATSSTVTSSATAGHSITDVLTSGPYAGQASNTVPLVDSYASVTPTNGSGTLGQITVDGVAVQYNVESQSLNTILSNIQTAVQAVDPTFTATLVGGKVEFNSTAQPISLGSASDTGNLLDVLQLSNAQLNNTANSGSITGTAGVGGINPDASFDTTTSAGFTTPVTGGYFTLNGVKITVSTGQNLTDIVSEINQSSAGVVATLNAATGQVVLTATQTGPTGIVLGASGDTSNFLAAAGLTTASGATTKIGSQAEVKVLNSDGSTTSYFSNTNTFTAPIPGISLNLQSSTTTPFTITVAQSTTQLVAALTNFACVYNTAINEINAATAPPVVTSVQPGSNATAQSVGGGVLYGNSDIQNVKNQLVNLVSGFLGSGSSYNSLSQLGLNLTDSFTTITTGNNQDATGSTGGTAASTSSSDSEIQSTSYEGTDGQLQALNLTTFLAAFNANPNAVYNVLAGANGLAAQVGTYLTGVTGAPTILNSGVVGTVPTTSLIQNYEDTNTDSITNLQQQIQQITDNANSQANNLRAQFTASEAAISELQSEQSELAAALGFTVSSNSSSSSSSS
jgi:flagellar hook-associated protein 2